MNILPANSKGCWICSVIVLQFYCHSVLSLFSHSCFVVFMFCIVVILLSCVCLLCVWSFCHHCFVMFLDSCVVIFVCNVLVVSASGWMSMHCANQYQWYVKEEIGTRWHIVFVLLSYALSLKCTRRDKMSYPLVNIQKAIENGHRNSGFSH